MSHLIADPTSTKVWLRHDTHKEGTKGKLEIQHKWHSMRSGLASCGSCSFESRPFCKHVNLKVHIRNNQKS
eukprot:4666985-Amphidinium_carterae.1